MAICSVEEAVEDIRQGRMIILVDDEDRENEGDITIAAEHVTPEAINFMAKYARGLICLPLGPSLVDKLDLPLMTQRNGSKFGTNFTVSIEARNGVTTGISAADRARTILVMSKMRIPRNSHLISHCFKIIPNGINNNKLPMIFKNTMRFVKIYFHHLNK